MMRGPSCAPTAVVSAMVAAAGSQAAIRCVQAARGAAGGVGASMELLGGRECAAGRDGAPERSAWPLEACRVPMHPRPHPSGLPVP